MRLSDILSVKGSAVVTVEPDCTVLEAVRTLVDHNIGAVVVVDEDHPVGILSERDVLRLTSEGPAEVGRTRVEDVMTHDVVYAGEEDTLASAMDVMSHHRIRHLPVMRDGDLVGMVSIGDVVNALRKEFEVENRHLKEYIAGGG